jgi:hypothetical protein
MPDTSDPKPKRSESHEPNLKAVDVTYEEYQQLADAYLEELQLKLEKMQENSEGIEVDYSVRQTSNSLIVGN